MPASVAVAPVTHGDDLAVIRGMGRRAFSSTARSRRRAGGSGTRRRGERVAGQRRQILGADADIARADLDNFVGGLPNTVRAWGCVRVRSPHSRFQSRR